MTRAELARPFSDEYQKEAGVLPQSLMLDPFHKFICEPYVTWLEAELEKARGK